MNYLRSLLFIVLPRLKLFWLVVIGLSLVAVVLLGRALSIDSHKQGSFLWQFLIYLGGALLGFACNAFFTCKDQFLLRACRDAVYLVSNIIPRPRVYELGDRVSLNALGGKWHEITHLSERMLQHLYRFFGAGKLSLREASVYEARGEFSEFAIVLNTRYGIPDLETRRKIWGDKAKAIIEVADLDRYEPGHDLVSSQYWPEMDRFASEFLGRAQSSGEAVTHSNIVAPITALEAQAAASLFLSDNLGDRFLASSPKLDVAAKVWRVPILLAYPFIGPVGQTGVILVNATSEEVVSYTPLEEMKAAARKLYDQNRDAIEAAFE